MKFAIPLLLFLLIAALLAAGMNIDTSRVPSPFIGKPLPAVEMPDLHEPGSRFATDRLPGHDSVSLLNVWATWCPPCREEHPVFLDIADHVPIYGINYKDDREDALDWLKRLGNPYVAVGYDSDGLVGIDLGVYGVPETYVVDGRGIIRHKHVGAVTQDVYEEQLRPVIEEVRRQEVRP